MARQLKRVQGVGGYERCIVCFGRCLLNEVIYYGYVSLVFKYALPIFGSL